MTDRLMQQVKEQFQPTNEKARLFECFQYKSKSCSMPRTVIAKPECHAGGTNLRFSVTNQPDISTAAE